MSSSSSAVPNSSNSNRLREVAANRGVPAYMIDRADQLRPGVAVAAKHASASPPAPRHPRCWCREVLTRLAELGATAVRELDGAIERTVFPLPKGLHGKATAKAPEVGPARD